MLYGDYFDAISSYDAAIRENPDYSEAFFNRGLAYVLIYANDRACEDFERTRSLGFEDAGEMGLKFCGR